MTDTDAAPAADAAPSLTLADVPALDVGTLTLGEMAEAEMQSGRSFQTLLTAGYATRKLLALWVHERRTSAQPRSWHELSALRPLGKRS